MKLKTFVIALPLLIASCASLTVDQEMAIACRGYASTLTILATYKDKMTQEQIKTVDEARAIINPICQTAASGEVYDLRSSLDTVRAELSKMLIVEKEVRK